MIGTESTENGLDDEEGGTDDNAAAVGRVTGSEKQLISTA